MSCHDTFNGKCSIFTISIKSTSETQTSPQHPLFHLNKNKPHKITRPTASKSDWIERRKYNSVCANGWYKSNMKHFQRRPQQSRIFCKHFTASQTVTVLWTLSWQNGAFTALRETVRLRYSYWSQRVQFFKINVRERAVNVNGRRS